MNRTNTPDRCWRQVMLFCLMVLMGQRGMVSQPALKFTVSKLYVWLHVGMNCDTSSRRPLTAAATLNLVTTRTLVRVLELLGFKWSPSPYEKIPQTSESGLYSWVVSSLSEVADPIDRPVIYVGIGARKNGGLRGRLAQELSLVNDSAGHAHGRAMFRLNGSPLGGAVHQKTGADLSSVKKEIHSSPFESREIAFRRLEKWLSDPKPTALSKAEQICIRAAVHIGDTSPPLNSHHAGAWGSSHPNDWAGWAAARILTRQDRDNADDADLA